MQLSDAKRTDVRTRRETRGTRRRDRAIAREAAAPVRQDVFEVGEEGMPVMELATTLAVAPSEIVKILFMKGIMVQVNQVGLSSVSQHAPLFRARVASLLYHAHPFTPSSCSHLFIVFVLTDPFHLIPAVLMPMQVLDRDAVHMVVDDFEDVEVLDREAAALEDWARKTTDFVDEEVSHLYWPVPST